MKNSSDTIGNRTRDLPNCGAVPQPTAPLRAPFTVTYLKKNYVSRVYKVSGVLFFIILIIY